MNLTKLWLRDPAGEQPVGGTAYACAWSPQSTLAACAGSTATRALALDAGPATELSLDEAVEAAMPGRNLKPLPIVQQRRV